jgi:hypothetical protein
MVIGRGVSKMKQTTKEFIKRMLEREIQVEFCNNDFKECEPIEYVDALIDAYIDFIKQYGEWYDKLATPTKKQLQDFVYKHDETYYTYYGA